MPLRFAILSDMHVHTDGNATPAFTAMAARVAESRPDLVVLADAAPAKLRLTIGHVPVASAIGHTNDGFRRALGGLLAAGGVAAYFCGHEHVSWDEDLDVGGGRTLRQVTVGTAGASYTFPL